MLSNNFLKQYERIRSLSSRIDMNRVHTALERCRSNNTILSFPHSLSSNCKKHRPTASAMIFKVSHRSPFFPANSLVIALLPLFLSQIYIAYHGKQRYYSLTPERLKQHVSPHSFLGSGAIPQRSPKTFFQYTVTGYVAKNLLVRFLFFKACSPFCTFEGSAPALIAQPSTPNGPSVSPHFLQRNPVHRSRTLFATDVNRTSETFLETSPPIPTPVLVEIVTLRYP